MTPRRLCALIAAGALSAFIAVPLLGAGDANANGRIPDGTGADSFGNDFILFPSTFGLLSSTDDGASFQWVCEVNVGYGGTYDPDYALTSAGDIWATTFEGLRVSRDSGCTWETVGGTILENRFFSDVEIAADGRIWTATATGGADNDVFVSSDNGTTFVSGGLPDEKIWWRSLEISTSDPNVIYVSGFKLAEPDLELPAESHLRKSIDGGATWQVLPVAPFAFGAQPNLFIEAISATDPDTLFVRVLGARDPVGDDIYRSTDGGVTWDAPLMFQDQITAFAILSDNTTVIAGSRGNCIGDDPDTNKGCVQRSTDLGATWTLATEQPKMGCLNQRANGELIACGANWEPDNFALGRSTDDGQTWDKIVRFSEIGGPLSCPMTSPQFECAAKDWPALCVQLGICDAADAGADATDAGETTGGDGGGDGGSCGCSSGAAGCALLLMIPLGWRSRRRKR